MPTSYLSYLSKFDAPQIGSPLYDIFISERNKYFMRILSCFFVHVDMIHLDFKVSIEFSKLEKSDAKVTQGDESWIYIRSASLFFFRRLGTLQLYIFKLQSMKKEPLKQFLSLLKSRFFSSFQALIENSLYLTQKNK